MACARQLFAAFLIGLGLAGSPAYAIQPDEILSDSALETRARTLSRDLRCMVCQNQSIDDSDAPLARDLRILVRERLTAGDNDEQVIDFLVARYGEFVLLKPRFGWHTAMLWAAPAALLLAGVLILLAFGRRKAAQPTAAGAPLSPAEQARLGDVLDRSG
jgi:cytochrome c-type biogenesis protein CcmH